MVKIFLFHFQIKISKSKFPSIKHRYEYNQIFAFPQATDISIANYFLNERNSLFEYFWQGFNVALISFGWYNPVLTDQDENLLSRILDKLFDYISFYDALSYSVGISGFIIHKPQKQAERFDDLLINQVTESQKELGKKSEESKNLKNIEVKTKEDAKFILASILKEANKPTYQGQLFIRLMLYNSKTKTVSNLHFVRMLYLPQQAVSII